jgi:hypothetical protein
VFSIGALVATLIAAASDVRAVTFVSAPAVLANSVSTASLDTSTKIFGFASIPAGGVQIINYNGCGNNPRWYVTNGDLFSGGGASGWDGDPAVAYSDTGTSNFWVCAHDSAQNGGIYCQSGHMMVNCDTVPTYDPVTGGDANPIRIGTRAFDAGSSPALVRVESVFHTWLVDLFARGQNGQIWSSYHFDTSVHSSWGAWTQLPALSGGFDSAPAATLYSTGRVIVCARKASNGHYACVNQEFGPVGSLQWGNWTEVSGYPVVTSKPALATDSNSIYLFGILGGDHRMSVSSLPLGGGVWSANTVIDAGYNFAYGPGAIRVSPSSKAMVVGTGGNSQFWWTTGSASAWTSGWQQAQY